MAPANAQHRSGFWFLPNAQKSSPRQTSTPQARIGPDWCKLGSHQSVTKTTFCSPYHYHSNGSIQNPQGIKRVAPGAGGCAILGLTTAAVTCRSVLVAVESTCHRPTALVQGRQLTKVPAPLAVREGSPALLQTPPSHHPSSACENDGSPPELDSDSFICRPVTGTKSCVSGRGGRPRHPCRSCPRAADCLPARRREMVNAGVNCPPSGSAVQAAARPGAPQQHTRSQLRRVLVVGYPGSTPQHSSSIALEGGFQHTHTKWCLLCSSRPCSGTATHTQPPLCCYQVLIGKV
jgi:hypothetical protein